MLHCSKEIAVSIPHPSITLACRRLRGLTLEEIHKTYYCVSGIGGEEIEIMVAIYGTPSKQTCDPGAHIAAQISSGLHTNGRADDFNQTVVIK